MMRLLWIICAVMLMSSSPLVADPLSPKEEQATFRLLPGFKTELVAAEPDVIDPVAMTIDEKGRIFVCEMRGYPNGGVATGVQTLGRIRCLTDANGDGLFETSKVFAEGLRFPTGIIAWNGGIIVCVAPDIIFLKDTNGDGIADEKRVLYTGFALDNIQQIVNSSTWGLDNWIHCVCGNAGGTITSPERPDLKPLVLRGRGIRFNPAVPGSLEPTSGGGQYGLTHDEAQHWFTATNSQHLRQIVLPDHYLKRNPNLSIAAVVSDIPQHGAACKVYRVSPFEAWRVERTSRRKDGPDAKRFPPTELFPGGYATSACSPLYYNDELYPQMDRQCVYVCDPANNLMMRDRLAPNGSLYTATRADQEVEFFASTDNWCRPVFTYLGPDGAIYILDFYREVIETPLSLPEDIKKRLNLESRGRGRIWRIVPSDYKYAPFPDLSKATTAEWVRTLSSPSAWQRTTARRILTEKKPADAVALIEKELSTANPVGKISLLSMLDTLGGLKPEHLIAPLQDQDANVVEVALRLSEPLLGKNETLRKLVIKQADHTAGTVRLQVAFTAGSLPGTESGPLLAKLLHGPKVDGWLQSAILSSVTDVGLLESLVQDQAFAEKNAGLLSRLASMAGAKGDIASLERVLTLMSQADSTAIQSALLAGLGQGMQNSKQPLNQLWDNPPAEVKGVITQARQVFEKAKATAIDEQKPLKARISAAQLLPYGPSSLALDALGSLLEPNQPAELTTAAFQSLALIDDPKVASLVLDGWDRHSPTRRREVIEILFARPARLVQLLDAIEAKKISPSQIDATRAEQLRQSKNVTLRERAKKLLVSTGSADRQKLVDLYRDSLTLKGDVAKGRELFRKNCTACHRLEDQGNEVGANLQSALRNKTKNALILDILDPSREVDSRYVNYQVTTTAGRTISGILAVETPTSITLRRGDKAEDTILRNQIDEIRATAKSLMPEEFEKQLDKQQLADLLEYLLENGK
jgi:putative membrane-bound dehydrogenase-like protein